MTHRENLEKIFYRAIERVDPYRIILDSLSLKSETLFIRCSKTVYKQDMKNYRNVYVLGMGKAAAHMAQALEEILKNRITKGAAITKYGQGRRLGSIRIIEAGHPIPDDSSIEGARVLYDIAMAADESTLIINLISGGGSALFCLPEEGVSLKDIQDMTRLLLKSGATIQEINTIRKHVSKVKGGKFARLAYPARMINIILSDVIGDRLDTIASGITVADKTTFQDAFRIIEKYSIGNRMPPSIIGSIRSGMEGKREETPKPDSACFENVLNILLGNNLLACEAAREQGESLGYSAVILTSSLSGEARETAKFFRAMAHDLEKGYIQHKRPSLIIAGGETTVTIRGKGKGGRNQEMALAFFVDLLEFYNGIPNIYFLSAGTDGIDGPTDAAGAIVSPELWSSVRSEQIDPGRYLKNNDSYNFFKRTAHLFVSGPTNTNVGDLQLLIVD